MTTLHCDKLLRRRLLLLGRCRGNDGLLLVELQRGAHLHLNLSLEGRLGLHGCPDPNLGMDGSRSRSRSQHRLRLDLKLGLANHRLAHCRGHCKGAKSLR